MDLTICFIDDSYYEHELVRDEIAVFAKGLKFIQAYTFDEAKELLGKNIPVLFLLDLWGKDLSVTDPILTSREELEMKISEFVGLDEIYKGIYDFQGDRTNEYLKRLFRIVDSWRNLFEDACNRLGQNRKYGLENNKQVKSQYPGVPTVFYTRKSLISDAVAMIEAGTDGLFIKPTGSDDSQTRIMTRNYAPRLLEDLTRIIDSKIYALRRFNQFYSSVRQINEIEIESLISNWKEFTNK